VYLDCAAEFTSRDNEEPPAWGAGGSRLSFL